MSIVLPKEIGYSPALPALPECSNIEIVASYAPDAAMRVPT